MLKRVTTLAACLVLGLMLTGCGEGETEHGIPKSPYAPTQAQLDEFNKQAMKAYSKVTHKAAARRHH